MKRVLIFAGTSEGRRLAKALAEKKIHSIVSVATEYGNEIMTEEENTSAFISIHQGRMDIDEMVDFIKALGADIVVDATHPFATQVSENIKKACSACGRELIRCLREENESAVPDIENSGKDCVYVNSMDEAIAYLNKTSGNIFVTTGSKEIGTLAAQIYDKNRLHVRVLPNTESIGLCEKAGIKGAKLYALQGPFDIETNSLMLRLSNAKYLLTKESGKAGGFAEKLAAAKEAKVIPVIIRRPAERGLSLEKTFEKVTKLCEIAENSALTTRRSLTLVGIGMGGSRTQLTLEAAEALEGAEIIFGAKRILASLSWCKTQKEPLYTVKEVMAYLQKKPEITNAAVAFSGDTGFYSGAKGFMELDEIQLKVLPGLTTVQVFAARLGMPWQDIVLCSIHGRNTCLMNKLRMHRRIFALAGDAQDIRRVSRQLQEYGFENSHIYVAVNLSYADEKIFEGTPSEFFDFEQEGLIAFMIDRGECEKRSVYSMPDAFFARGKVPMTKEEVRAVSVAKLRLTPDAILFDVGAGTGSVAVECAGYLPDGEVFAIEKKEEAAALIQINARAAAGENLHVIHGTAPEVFEKLPVPTHVFIGGTSGNLDRILAWLLDKNPNIRIVINAITLETQSEILRYIKENQRKDAEIITMQIARSESVAAYHMMRGENPIMIAVLNGYHQ